MISGMFDKTKQAGFQEPLSDEENMKSDILKQEDLLDCLDDMNLSTRSTPTTYGLISKSHAALLNRVAELEKGKQSTSDAVYSLQDNCRELEKMLQFVKMRKEELEQENEDLKNGNQQMQEMSDHWQNKCRELEENLTSVQFDCAQTESVLMVAESKIETLNSKIAELEKQLADKTVGLEINVTTKRYRLCEGDDWTVISEGDLSVSVPIEPVDFYDFKVEKPKRLDTRDEAREKAFADAASWIDSDVSGCSSAPVIHDREEHFYQCSVDGKKHYYAVPREPQLGDILVFDGYSNQSEKHVTYPFKVSKLEGKYAWSDEDIVTPLEDCKPTGYRWDTDTESIVKIEEGE